KSTECSSLQPVTRRCTTIRPPRGYKQLPAISGIEEALSVQSVTGRRSCPGSSTPKGQGRRNEERITLRLQMRLETIETGRQRPGHPGSPSGNELLCNLLKILGKWR